MRLIGVIGGVVAIGLAAFLLFRFANPPTALPPCQPAAGEDVVACSTIDGFPIGPAGSVCTSTPDSCDPDQMLAVAGFGTRDPGHPQIARTRLYDLDMSRVCGPVLCTLTGSATIFVFDLADGTRRAIGVHRPGVAPTEVWPVYGK